MLSISRAVEVNPPGPTQLHDPPLVGCGPRSTTVDVELTVAADSAVQTPLTETYGTMAVAVQVPVPTVNAMLVVAVVLPDVPVTTTVTGPPVVAVLLAIKVSVLEVVDDVGLKEAVTPLGKPLAVNVTLPVKPPSGVTVMVSVAVLPCVTESVDAESDSVKPEPVVPVPTKVVILCPGSEYVKASFDTLTAPSCAIWFDAEVW
jgi:hypothetical protein